MCVFMLGKYFHEGSLSNRSSVRCRDAHGGSKEVIDSMTSNMAVALSAQYWPPPEVPLPV